MLYGEMLTDEQSITFPLSKAAAAHNRYILF